jgi:hypothetical protein
MDWRSLGYWPIWKDGKKVWVPRDAEACLDLDAWKKDLNN